MLTVLFDKTGRNMIPDAMKRVAGRTGQEYNVRKNRKGAIKAEAKKPKISLTQKPKRVSRGR